jgi:hypothetical protein
VEKRKSGIANRRRDDESQFRMSELKTEKLKARSPETTTGEARALSHPGSPSNFRKQTEAN